MLVNEVMDYLRQQFDAEVVTDPSRKESISFQLPKELRVMLAG